jgi:hypothetical protein
MTATGLSDLSSDGGSSFEAEPPSVQDTGSSQGL